MIKRTLYFGSDAYLHSKQNQLVVKYPDSERKNATVPIEDIGVVILDAFRLTISQQLITKLIHNNVALITCDERHMPQGLMLNLDANSLQQERFNIQIEVSLPLKKQLWQQTIKAKIGNQMGLLLKLKQIRSATLSRAPNKESYATLSRAPNKESYTTSYLAPNKSNYATSARTPNKNAKHEYENMAYWQRSVRSGDPDNYEARAAAFYWAQIFSENVEGFKRGRFEAEPNNLLNYGYAILRAITARSLVASGLLPTFGIHHHNKYNAYALADDIMEPYRPYVDQIVKALANKYYPLIPDGEILDLMPEIKKELLQIPVIDVIIDEEKSPLMIAMQRTTASLFQCFAGINRKILYPEIQIE